MAANRAMDKKLLDVVRARARGKSVHQIAAEFGARSGNVTTQTNAVMDADLKESGEPPEIVAAAYWPRKK